MIADLKRASRLNTNKESQKVFRSLDKKVQYQLISALVSAEDSVMITVGCAKQTSKQKQENKAQGERYACTISNKNQAARTAPPTNVFGTH